MNIPLKLAFRVQELADSLTISQGDLSLQHDCTHTLVDSLLQITVLANSVLLLAVDAGAFPEEKVQSLVEVPIAERGVQLLSPEESLVVLLWSKALLIIELRPPVLNGLLSKLAAGFLTHQDRDVVTLVAFSLLEALLFETGREIVHVLHAETSVASVAEVRNHLSGGHLDHTWHSPLRDQVIEQLQFCLVLVFVIHDQLGMRIRCARTAALDSTCERVV
mmetsp:Transcript_119710/g.168486  ORF Transcript_119710/g.168486 Transcript_119710/m.168486 type:complete len:220 (+) Transcript_119710:144-803(+)